MSSSLTNLIPSQTQTFQVQRLLKPNTLPIPLLSDSLAKQYSYAHTAWLLIYYYMRSGTLVADPLNTMILDIIPIVIGQCMFCAVCIPSSGNWNSGTNAGKIIEGTGSGNARSTGGKSVNVSGAHGTASLRKRVGPQATKNSKATGGLDGKEAGGGGGSWTSRVMPSLFSFILAIAIPPVPLFLLALVMGAPLYPTSLLPHTMLLSVHVSLLATLPIFYAHGVSTAAWRDVAAAWLPFDEAGVWGGTIGTIVGAWIGAIPMALDWDREWQKWPCTVLWGAVLGWGVGRLMTQVLKIGLGKRINLSEARSIPPEPKEVKSIEDKDK